MKCFQNVLPLFVLFIGIDVCGASAGEWTAMNSGTTSLLLDVWAASSDEVYAVGYAGSDRAILSYDGSTWQHMSHEATTDPQAVWGHAGEVRTYVFTVGRGGLIMLYDGGGWSIQESSTTEDLFGIYGFSVDDVYAGGVGVIVHFDGSRWSTVYEDQNVLIRDFWGSASDDIYAVGKHQEDLGGFVLHFDGSDWKEIYTAERGFFDVHGFGRQDVYTVGYPGVHHYDGSAWTEIDTGTILTTYTGIWGSSSKNIYTIDGAGEILHFDGTGWEISRERSDLGLRGITGNPAGEVWAVGYSGTILHYQPDDVPETTTTTSIEPSTTTTIPATASGSKAVIVAGGGPFEGNALWDATGALANYAYKTLTVQGFSAEDIYYLTADELVDVEPDGTVDRDAGASNDDLEYALTTWAQDADNVIVYLTDHGGSGTFRMGETEVLFASELGAWIDELQESVPGTVLVIYDACRSGSFLPDLAPPAGMDRILIASSDADEPAYFLTEGTVSFSRYFWGNVFNGMNVYDSFTLAKNAMQSPGYQNPLLDDSGNGIGNEKEDGALAQSFSIGSGIVSGADIPAIGSLSVRRAGEEVIITADEVTATAAVVMVWALIRGAGTAASLDNPVLDVPAVVLQKKDTGTYAGSYAGCTDNGTYHIAAYAIDAEANTSLPKVATLQGSGTTGGPCVLQELYRDSPEKIALLRRFRDRVLVRSAAGRRIAAAYAGESEQMLRFIQRHPGVRKAVLSITDSCIRLIDMYLPAFSS